MTYALTRREFFGGISAAVCLAGCRSVGEGGGFSFSVLNPDCMVGGAGLCVVMRTPLGKTYLFDTANGDFRGKKRKNNGRDIVAPWLKAHGIDVIDGLVISHYHADHFGGFLWLSENFPVRRVFNNGFVPPLDGLSVDDRGEYTCARTALDRWAARHPGRLVEGLKSGDDLGWNEDDVDFDVVWPPHEGPVCSEKDRPGYGKADGTFHHLLNANSNALRVTAFGKVFFIMGDIQPDYLRSSMRPALERVGKWGCDFAVLPAHGTMSSEAIVDIKEMKPRPKTVVASLGNVSWMMNTGLDVIRRYSEAGFSAFSTNVHGDVAAALNGSAVVAPSPRLYPYDPV